MCKCDVLVTKLSGTTASRVVGGASAHRDWTSEQSANDIQLLPRVAADFVLRTDVSKKEAVLLMYQSENDEPNVSCRGAMLRVTEISHRSTINLIFIFAALHAFLVAASVQPQSVPIRASTLQDFTAKGWAAGSLLVKCMYAFISGYHILPVPDAPGPGVGSLDKGGQEGMHQARRRDCCITLALR
eukprot:1996892-Rhodomonas_salina.2